MQPDENSSIFVVLVLSASFSLHMQDNELIRRDISMFQL